MSFLKRFPRVKDLPESYFEVNSSWASINILLVILFILSLLSCHFLAFEFGHKKYLFFLTPLLGAQIYKLTIVMHDACHFTLYKSRASNIFIGRLCEAFLGTSFAKFRAAHFEHHRYCGTVKDTAEGNFRKLEGCSPLYFIYHMLRPLFGFGYLDALKYYAKYDSMETAQKRLPFQTPWFIRVIMTLVVQLLIIIIATGFWQQPVLIIVYPLIAATFGIFFSRLRGLAEHVSHYSTPLRGECFVRTHSANWFDEIFFYCLNMNYHLEHHLYPAIPSANLSKVSGYLQSKYGYDEDHFSRSVLMTFYKILKGRQDGFNQDFNR